MIPKTAIRNYLNREVDDWLWMKDLNERDIDDRIADLKPRPQFISPLGFQQKVCFLLGVAYPGFAFWLDMGLGKSLLTLELMRYWWRCGDLKQGLILCKTGTAMVGWEDEIFKWNVRLPYVLLDSQSSKEKWKTLNYFRDGLVFVTYPGMVAMLSDRVPSKKKGRADRMKLKVNRDAVEEFSESTTAFALDESTYVGHHSTLAWEIIDRIADKVDIRYALAGRPFGKDPTPLWAQHFLIDRGETLGTTLGIFREAFFSKKRNPFAKRARVYDYTFKEAKRPELSRLIQHRSIAFATDECIKLPPINPFIKAVSLPEEAETYCDKLIQRVIAAKGNYREMKNMFLRMRQLSSGFLGFKDDETGDRAEVEFDENPKLEALIDLVEALPYDCKAVIFHEFRWSGRRIQKALEELGVGFGRIVAGMKDFPKVKRDFDFSKWMQVLLVPNRLGNYSLNLQVANYSMIFESPVSPVDREQLERRTRRQGQLKRLFQYDLLMRGTMDERILQWHKEGDSLFDALVRNPIGVLNARSTLLPDRGDRIAVGRGRGLVLPGRA